MKDPDSEPKSHVRQLYAPRAHIVTRHTHMEVELGLMALDGTVNRLV